MSGNLYHMLQLLWPPHLTSKIGRYSRRGFVWRDAGLWRNRCLVQREAILLDGDMANRAGRETPVRGTE
jgi:hypothetical protein